MTKEEAINLLADMDSDKYTAKEAVALTMAIKALEAWNEVQKEIYRQIDYLDEIHECRDRKAYYTALDIVNKYLKEVEHGSN